MIEPAAYITAAAAGASGCRDEAAAGAMMSAVSHTAPASTSVVIEYARRKTSRRILSRY
jgi:hypothetical protein